MQNVLPAFLTVTPYSPEESRSVYPTLIRLLAGEAAGRAESLERVSFSEDIP